jgi:hypothetical protein
MRIAVLFDGAGLARRGLENCGHDCVGVELDEWKCHLADLLCDGESHCMDARDFPLDDFDAVWASPPCQSISICNTRHAPSEDTLLQWALALPHKVLWVENVLSFTDNSWGTIYNAAQFTPEALQNRNRIIGGRYLPPRTFHPYKRRFPDAVPCITATEYKCNTKGNRRATRAFGRRLDLDEVAFYQGLDIPPEWFEVPYSWPESAAKWTHNLYQAIGNGVPVYMAQAFGEHYEME